MNGGMMFNNDGAMQLPPGVGEIIPGVLYVGPHTACERMVSDFGVRYVVECLSDEERRNLYEQRYRPLIKNLQYSKQIIAALSEAVECCLETGTLPSPSTRTNANKKGTNHTIEQQPSLGLQADDVAALRNARSSLLREFGDKGKSNSTAWDQLGDADAKTTEAPEDVELMWTRTKQEYLNLILEKALSASNAKRDAGTAVAPHTAKLIESVEKYQRLVAEAVKEETGDAGDDEEDTDQRQQHADPTAATSYSPSKAPEGLVEDPSPSTAPAPAESITASPAPQLSAEDQEALWRGYKLVYPPKVRLVTVPMDDSLTEDLTMALNSQKPIQPFQRFGIGSEKVPADGIDINAAALPTHVYRHKWSVEVGVDGKQRLVPTAAGGNKPAVATTEEDLIDELDGHTKAHAVARDAQHRLGLEHVGVPLVSRPEGLPTPLPIVTFLDEILCQNPSVSYLEELSTIAMTKMLAKQRKEQDAALGYQPSKLSELNDDGKDDTDDAASPVIPVYERHAVFIHCYAGKSRAPAITAAYLLLSQYLAARTSDAGGSPDIFVPVTDREGDSEGGKKEPKSHVTAFNRRGPYYANPPLHNLEEAMELLCHCGPLTVTRGFNVPSVPNPASNKDDDDAAGEEEHAAEVDPNSVAEIVLEDSAVQAIHSICTATHKQYETLVALQQQLLEAKIASGNTTSKAPAPKKNDTGLNDDTVPGENDVEAEEEAQLTKEEELLEMQANVEKGSRQVKVLSEFLKQIKDAHAFNRKALTNLRKDYESAYIDRHLTPSSDRASNSEGSTMDGLGAAGSKMAFGRVVAKGRGVRPNPKFIQDLLGLENAVMQAHNRVVEFNEFFSALKAGQTFNAKQLKAIAASALEGDEPYPTAFDQDDYNLEGLLDLFVRGESGHMITTLTEPEVYKIFMSPEVDRDVVKARRVCTKEHAKKLFSTTGRRRQMADTICTLLNEDEELRIAHEKKAAKEAALAAGLKSNGAAGGENKNIFTGKGIQIIMSPESIIKILAECKDDMQVAIMQAMAEKKRQLEKAVAAEMEATH